MKAEETRRAMIRPFLEFADERDDFGNMGHQIV